MLPFLPNSVYLWILGTLDNPWTKSLMRKCLLIFCFFSINFLLTVIACNAGKVTVVLDNIIFCNYCIFHSGKICIQSYHLQNLKFLGAVKIRNLKSFKPPIFFFNAVKMTDLPIIFQKNLETLVSHRRNTRKKSLV